MTVLLRWPEGIAAEEAQHLATPEERTALLWVGVPPAGSPPDALFDPTLGYRACGTLPGFLLERSNRIGSFGGDGFRVPEVAGNGVTHALAEVRHATTNLAEAPTIDGIADVGVFADLQATADAFASEDPQVDGLVVTGPSDAVTELVDAPGADAVHLLEVDFDRGAPEPCG